MIDSLRKLNAILSPRDRRNAAILLVLMLIGALLEIVGLAAVPAFVSSVVYPESLERYPMVQDVLAALELTEPGDLVIAGGIALIAVFGVKTAFLLFNYRLHTRYTSNRHVNLAQRLTNAYMRAPFTFHLERNTAELLRNTDREANVISYAVIGALLELLTHTTILTAVLVFLFLVEPWITFWWITVFGLLGGVQVVFVSARLKRYGLREQQQRKIFAQSLYQGFGCIKEARVLNREAFFADKVSSCVRNIAAVMRFKQFVIKSIPPVTEFLALAGLVAVAAALVLLGRPAESILVTLSLFIVGLVRLRQTISAAMLQLTNLRYNMVSIDPVHADLMQLEGRGGGNTGDPTAEPRHLRQQIELRQVWYRYDKAKDHALRDVSLTIPAGTAIGFVGSTGAGKSTLVDIILGLLEPEMGGVFVDGADIRTGGVGRWQRTIGYVPQSIYLLDDTIRRNIALGINDADIDEDALQTAVRAAQLERFVDHQPDGLDTVIGEQGSRISGGERQRIGIARALYHNPDVLVLDEATSALDNTTERTIITAVEALKGRRTIIMIAHRLSTVRNCDVLCFLKDGRIERQGTFESLADQNAEFRIMSSGETGT